MRKLRISSAAILLLAVVVVSKLNLHAQNQAADNTHWPPSVPRNSAHRVGNAPEYQDVSFGDTLYRLPAKKYRIWVQQYDKEHDHAAFGFSAILPDVAPATDDPAEAATWGTGTGWHRELHVLVEYGRNYISQEKTLENAFSESRSMKALQDKAEKEGRPDVRFQYIDKNTYTILLNGCKRYDGYSIGGNVIQVCGAGESLLVIKCDLGLPRMPFPSPYCKVMFNLSEKTQLTYSFGYDYFNQAPNIHRKLVALLASFHAVSNPSDQSNSQSHPK